MIDAQTKIVKDNKMILPLLIDSIKEEMKKKGTDVCGELDEKTSFERLGMDSLDIIETIFILEDKLGHHIIFNMNDKQRPNTLGELAKIIDQK